ncbi:hypothetical protein H4R35_001659 [Dimargaris xerosporica]|nr:hypothetical protein H4R35_001659 [Dimargaris xerosporica]
MQLYRLGPLFLWCTYVAAKRSEIPSFGPYLPNRIYQVLTPSASPVTLDIDMASPHRPKKPVANSLQTPYRHLRKSRRMQPALLEHDSPVAAALLFAHESFELTEQDYRISAVTRSRFGVTHVYLQQMVQGIPVENGVMNINVHDTDGKILSFGNSFAVYGAHPSALDQLVSLHRRDDRTVDPVAAFLALANYLEYHIQDPVAIQVIAVDNTASAVAFELTHIHGDLASDYEMAVQLALLSTDHGRLVPVYQIQWHEGDTWLQGIVAVDSLQVLSITNWSAPVSYRVFPMGVVSQATGHRQLIANPEDFTASPQGWTSTTALTTPSHGGLTTSGNNVHAQENWSGKPNWQTNYRPSVSDNTAVFDFPLPSVSIASHREAIDAAVTNLFYWCNLLHDILYHYGFTEAVGNFQDDNYDRGGHGKDAVIAMAQTGPTFNKAVFTTPPDGKQPTLRMHLWDKTHPPRDGALTSDIIIHEYLHGVSGRLTGGPTNVGCLGWDEAAAMGEGWGDFFAVILHRQPGDAGTQPVGIGEYVVGGHGLRPYPYSTDMATNPVMYQDVYRPQSPFNDAHANGMIWASMLLEVYWDLVNELGFTTDWHSASLQHGNTLMVQLVITAMILQPCYPKFLQARDAILQADEVVTGAKYQCHIWRGFARRGLGFKATYQGNRRAMDTTLPLDCQAG